jgi:pimeloyl-ACP methyl ester carboxylesterase
MSAAQHRTFVLVHGAWHGGWCWRRVADRLAAAGHRVFTPTLTGLGERQHLMSASITLDTHVQDVCNLIRFEELSDICLVGHSYAGMVISRVAEEMEDRISSFVFLDAFVPEDGQTPLDLITAHVQADIRAAMARGEITRPAPSAAYFKVQSPSDVAWIDSMMTPQPNGVWPHAIHLTGARDRIARRAYVRAGLYPNPNFDAAMEKQSKRDGWRVMSLAGGHDLMVDAPEELANLLIELS